MQQQQHLVETDDGAMPVYVSCPDSGGPFPVVLYLMDAIGFRRELREGARRLAEAGYCVLLPDFYYREGEYHEMDIMSDQETIMKLFGAFSLDAACGDIDRVLEFAAGLDEADTSRAGAVGYCMGGALALRAAGHLKSRLQAAAAIHPGNLVSDRPDSPHRHVEGVTAQLYLGIADNDPYATPDDVETLKGELDRAGVAYEVEFYRGAEHGFTFPSLPSYNREASERQWERVSGLFARQLASRS